jgi:hypothetical protein
MNFTKTFTSIQIDENFNIYQPCTKEAYLGTAVPGLKGIVENLKCVPMKIGGQLFKEIAVCIHLAGRFPTKLLDYAITIMYEKIEEEKDYRKNKEKIINLKMVKYLHQYIWD